MERAHKRPINSILFICIHLTSTAQQTPFASQMQNSTPEAHKDHCKFCFQSLLWHFAPQEHPKPSLSIAHFSTALFITWNSTLTGELRGCIGTLKPQPLPLAQSLSQYAIHSATRDHRFAPISPNELPNLQVTVSFLHTFEVCAHWNDWIVGVHGIEIEIEIRDSEAEAEVITVKSATFLPSVPLEQHWGHRETIRQLMRKAGCKSGDLEAVVKVVRYQCSKCTRNYSELGLEETE